MDLLVVSGATQIILSEGSQQSHIVKRNGYVPLPPEIDAVDIRTPGSIDGTRRIEASYRNVTETFDVWFVDPTGTTPALTMRQTISTILERLFQIARDRNGGTAPPGVIDPVYVQHRVAPTEDFYQREIIDGKLVWDKTLYELWMHPDDTLRATISWTRKPGWDALTETQVITSDAISNVGTAVPITHTAGNMDAPLRLTITNTYADRMQKIFVVRNLYSDPPSWDPSQGGVSSTASATLAEMGSWALTSAILAQCGGNDFHALGRFLTKPADTWFQWQIQFQSDVMWQSDLFQVETAELVLMGREALSLPPGWSGNSVPHGLTLHLFALSETGGTVTMSDLYLMPLDSWRVYEPVAYGMANSVRLVDDPLNERVYTDGWSGSTEVMNYSTIGSEILVKPNTDQSLHLLWGTGTVGGSAAAATATINGYIKERRMTI